MIFYRHSILSKISRKSVDSLIEKVRAKVGVKLATFHTGLLSRNIY